MNRATITYYQTHYTREPRAYCNRCGTVWAHWESEDLDYHAHECQTEPETETQ